jgi:rhamnosyl/mannosyltransferase
MYGKPMISSEIGTGTSFVNISGETGLVVPPNDPAALRQAMQYLRNNPKHATEMGRRGEARYRQLFTGDKMAKAYVDLYERLASAEQPSYCYA